MLSIIIPTLDAEPYLTNCVTSIFDDSSAGLIEEIIIVDGGSTDTTISVASNRRFILTYAVRGRGNQLSCGAEIAKADWLLFLHADTLLDKGWSRAVRTFIENPSNCRKAGYFGFKLDDSTYQARVLELLVRWRCRFFGLPYGDQGLLISSEFYRNIGGYRPLELMEDVDLVRRIGSKSLVYLPKNIITSADRYRTEGYLARACRNFTCFVLYTLGVPISCIKRIYY